MPLDTRIALGVQPLQLADPLAREGQVQNILASQAQQRAAGMQQQSAQMQMDQTQRQLRQDEDYVSQMTKAIGENGGPSDMMQAFRIMATHRNPQVSQQGVTGLQSLRRLDEAKKAGIYGAPAPVIPNVGPTPGAMGSGTFGMDQNVPMFNQRNVPPLNLTTPAPVMNQLTPPPAAPVNQLAAAPPADAAKTLQTKYMKLSQFTDVPGVKEQMDFIKEQYKALLNQRNTAFAPIDASKYTPASLKAFNLSGNQSDLVAVTKAEKTIGTVSPADFTAASLAKYAESNDFKDLVPAPKAPGAPATPAAPVAVVGADGKVKYVSREEAINKGMTPASAMEGLAPKEIQNREAKYPMAKRATATVSATMTEIENTIDRLLANENGLNGITGFVGGRTFAVTDAARKAEADLKQLKNLAFVQGLTELRNASSTGAGVGNVSNKEGDRFENLKASLEQTQSLSDLIASLKRLKSQSTATRDTVNQAFEDTYAYRANAPAGGGAPPLPPGFKRD